ncbi:MAG: TIGR01212 family radical SAM protein [Tissierellales bacterium]|nr:TIGR01212 family radical SAM protein [Tissierellales bacterium]MBN2828408.1 TIGR01212 family radical SAM protein [Tissierellales bacterium]
MDEKIRYRTLDKELKKRFGHKVIKLSVNGGFTCPNRDGSISDRGCIFCSEEGNGEFAGSPQKSITEQISSQIVFLSKKWKADRYIVYFGAFTNTYAPVHILRKKFYEALEYPGVVGLAIATRADCIDEDILELLDEINRKYYLWVEIGLQTIHSKSSDFIRRGYDLQTFENSFFLLKRLGIQTVIHLIIGLPAENHQDIQKTIEYVSYIMPWGVKIHLLHVVKGTDLEHYYNTTGFELMERTEYVNTVCDCIEKLDDRIIVHRITGDGKKSNLIGPLWSLEKLKVISEIRNELIRRDSFQGCRIK